jgi:hypothetical protein
MLRNIILIVLSGLVFTCSVQATDPLALLGLHLRYDIVFLPLLLAAFFVLLSRLPKNFAHAGPVLLSVSLCGLVLAGVWQEQVSDLATLAGLYPHSDGRSYLNGALNLLHGQDLNTKASRRPLAIVFWAGLLHIGAMNLKIALALMVFIAALALGFLSRALYRSYGWQVGYVVFLGLFLFYRRFIGTFLTEHLGLALGCLACMLLLQALHEQRRSFFYAGLLLLTLALNVRAGAFFILPCLVLWAGWHWREQKIFSFKVSILALIALIGGFAANSLALHSIGQTEASQGNFSYTLYGLVHGGDWTLVMEEHPELLLLPEIERHQAIYDLAWHTIASEPGTLLYGAARAYRAFFGTTHGPYSFVLFALQQNMLSPNAAEGGIEAINISEILQAIGEQPLKYTQIILAFVWYGLLLLLAGVGFLFIIQSRHPIQGFMLCAWLGILTSVPFIPPWDVDLMRVHAASLPLILLPPAFGFAALFTRCNRELLLPQQSREGGLFLPLSILCLVLVLPLWFAHKKTNIVVDRTCIQGEPWLLRVVQGSLITVKNEAALREKSGILASNYPRRAAALLEFFPEHTLALGYEGLSGTLRYLVFDREQEIPKDWLQLCVHPGPPDENIWWHVDTKAVSARSF